MWCESDLVAGEKPRRGLHTPEFGREKHRNCTAAVGRALMRWPPVRNLSLACRGDSRGVMDALPQFLSLTLVKRAKYEGRREWTRCNTAFLYADAGGERERPGPSSSACIHTSAEAQTRSLAGETRETRERETRCTHTGVSLSSRRPGYGMASSTAISR